MKECDKCSRLEKKLAETSKKANEAQERMNSIAKILCLGNLESNGNEQRNTALSIVSQMLLDSSPKRKRRCLQSKSSPLKENVLMEGSMDTLEIAGKKDENEEGAVGGIVPGTMDHSPLKQITNVPSAKTPPKKGSQESNSRLSSSINLPIKNTRVTSVKKNLTTDCIEYSNENEDVFASSPVKNRKKGLSFDIGLENIVLNKNVEKNTIEGTNVTTLDDTLLEYVKDGRSELDKIWFDDDPNGGTKLQQNHVSTPPFSEDSKISSSMNQIIEETPIRSDNDIKEHKKMADFWLLKEKRELCGKSKSLDGKKLKQTKLELGVRKKAVDISTLAGFNGGVLQLEEPQQGIDKDEDIIPGSPGSQLCGGSLAKSNVLSDDDALEPTGFRPIATSTQRPSTKENLSLHRPTTSNKPSEFVYKRDAVKKKGERAKLPGWDCYECCKYYNAMALSPSKAKERMNACSRHRDKFQPKGNDTPASFWNPLFPDTQECREKGMYVSVHCPTTDS